MRQFRVLVNGNEYKVAIEELDEVGGAATEIMQPQQQNQPVVSKPAASSAPKAITTPKPESNGDTSSGVIKAAMPGTILDVKISVGETVVRGQALLILEAMKMENEIMAPADGVISEIHATVGASVNSGDVLIVMS